MLARRPPLELASYVTQPVFENEIRDLAESKLIRQELVLCHQCIFAKAVDYAGLADAEGEVVCTLLADPDGGLLYVDPDAFCYWGEKEQPEDRKTKFTLGLEQGYVQ